MRCRVDGLHDPSAFYVSMIPRMWQGLHGACPKHLMHTKAPKTGLGILISAHLVSSTSLNKKLHFKP